VIFTVELERGAYDVVVENGARERLATLIAEKAPRAKSAVVVTSSSLAQRPWFDVTVASIRSPCSFRGRVG